MPATRKPTALGSLANLIGFHLRLAQLAVFKDFESELGEIGVTPAVYSVLEVLQKNPGLTQSKLASAVRLDRSSMVPMLDKLGKRGLVERLASTTDRRHNHLFLTTAGTDLLRLADDRVALHEARVCAEFAPAEKRALIKLLKRFGG
ncbi:MAG: MarR family transcriptional regulator [Burkholderiaceae bacterium]|nr:MarR family transcriptional regulator [Sulfuritalea sp.]MCF8175132.1 MarR family transcriptional regulator [Burkholderiaceae bacterium]